MEIQIERVLRTERIRRSIKEMKKDLAKLDRDLEKISQFLIKRKSQKEAQELQRKEARQALLRGKTKEDLEQKNMTVTCETNEQTQPAIDVSMSFEKGALCLEIKPSKESMEAKELNNLEGDQANIRKTCGDFKENIPLPDFSISCESLRDSCESLLHLPEETKVLKEIKRPTKLFDAELKLEPEDLYPAFMQRLDTQRTNDQSSESSGSILNLNNYPIRVVETFFPKCIVPDLKRTAMKPTILNVCRPSPTKDVPKKNTPIKKPNIPNKSILSKDLKTNRMQNTLKKTEISQRRTIPKCLASEERSLQRNVSRNESFFQEQDSSQQPTLSDQLYGLEPMSFNSNYYVRKTAATKGSYVESSESLKKKRLHAQQR